jgi:AraC-like DNA-binding protein/quercetin dioxygenase-like cupin family protein
MSCRHAKAAVTRRATARVRGILSLVDVEMELRPARVSVGTVTYPPGGTLGPRSQADVQLVLIHAGSAQVWIDDTPRLLTAGEVGLLLPGHRERFEFDARVATRHSWVQAEVPELSRTVRERLAALPAVLPLSRPLDALAREAVSTAATALPTSPFVLAHLAAAALWRYVGEAERQAPERMRPVDDAERYIDANLHDPALTLDRIARSAHVSPAHLIRSFRAAHGSTPMANVWQRRVTVGVDLLVNTGLPLATVAERCGFKTVHHFSRRVKATGGLPPGALRRARWDAAGAPTRSGADRRARRA